MADTTQTHREYVENTSRIGILSATFSQNVYPRSVRAHPAEMAHVRDVFSGRFFR